MTKIAYNACYGGFGLSHDAIKRYAELKGVTIYAFVNEKKADGGIDLHSHRLATDEEARKAFMVHYCTTPEFSNDTYWSSGRMEKDRSDPNLIQVIEELGDAANGQCAKLRIEEIPAGTQYRIDEYDGNETVATQDSYDWKTA